MLQALSRKMAGCTHLQPPGACFTRYFGMGLLWAINLKKPCFEQKAVLSPVLQNWGEEEDHTVPRATGPTHSPCTNTLGYISDVQCAPLGVPAQGFFLIWRCSAHEANAAPNLLFALLSARLREQELRLSLWEISTRNGKKKDLYRNGQSTEVG
jgi:hypothetical protein